MPDDRIKRPAYQWNVVDAEGDEVFQLMTYEQQGIYRALLDRQWREGSIPADPKLIFILLPKLKSFERFKKHIWPLVSAKFQPHAVGRLQNARLERYRAELDGFVKIQAENGARGAAKRWGRHSEPIATPMANDSTLTTTTTTTTKNKNTSAEASSAPPSLTVLEFPTVGIHGNTWALSEQQVADWNAAFPSLDILAEARKALAWLQANPGRRKTVAGMPKFLVGWLGRVVDHGRPVGAAVRISRHAKWQSDGRGEIADV